MTEELKKLIQESHTEELEDKAKYLKLSEQAKSEGIDCAMKVLRDLADEEQSHADLLANILSKF